MHIKGSNSKQSNYKRAQCIQFKNTIKKNKMDLIRVLTNRTTLRGSACLTEEGKES
jgi:hypothetical protein